MVTGSYPVSGAGGWLPGEALARSAFLFHVFFTFGFSFFLIFHVSITIIFFVKGL